MLIEKLNNPARLQGWAIDFLVVNSPALNFFYFPETAKQNYR